MGLQDRQRADRHRLDDSLIVRALAGLGVVVASTLGCSDQRDPTAEHARPSSETAPVLSFDEAFALMSDPLARQELADAVAREPEESKAGGLSYGTALLTMDGAILGDGIVDVPEARLLVGNLGLDAITGHVICVAATAPVPCTPDSDIFTWDIPGRQAASMLVTLDPRSPATNLLVVPDGEQERAIVMAGRRQILTAELPSPRWYPPTWRAPIMDPEAFGCGTVWLTASRDRHDGYRPLRGRERDDPLWAVLDPCPEMAGSVGQLVLILDGTVAHVLGAGYFTIPSATIAIEVSELIDANASTAQGVFLTADGTHTSFSQAVTFG